MEKTKISTTTKLTKDKILEELKLISIKYGISYIEIGAIAEEKSKEILKNFRGN